MMISLLSKAADDGRTLTGLWKQYYEASKADRPQKEAEILQKIREEALVKRLPVDFYDAGKEYVSVVERRDWKKSSQLRLEFGELVKKFDYPKNSQIVLKFDNNLKDICDYIRTVEEKSGYSSK